jgi:hypothetical protein
VRKDRCDERTPFISPSPGEGFCGAGCVMTENNMCDLECNDIDRFKEDDNETSSTYRMCVKIPNKESKKNNFPWWIFIIIASLLLIVVMIIILIIIYKKKKKKPKKVCKEEVITPETVEEKEDSFKNDASEPHTLSDPNDQIIETGALPDPGDTLELQDLFFYYYYYYYYFLKNHDSSTISISYDIYTGLFYARVDGDYRCGKRG